MKVFLSAFVGLLLPSVLYAGTTSITTYYPAPDGNYKNLSSQLFTETGVEQGPSSPANDLVVTAIGDPGCTDANLTAIGMGLTSKGPLDNPMADTPCVNYTLLSDGTPGDNGDLYINRPSKGNIYFLENNNGSATFVTPPAKAQLMIQGTTGNVGIGSVNPLTLLDVEGGAFVRANGATAASGLVVQGDPAAATQGGLYLTNTPAFVLGSAGAWGYKFIPQGTGSATNAYLRIGLVNAAAPNTYITDELTLMNNFVGIDETDPLATLQIAGAGSGYTVINDGGCGSNYSGITLSGVVPSGCTNYNFLSDPTDENLYINRPSGAAINFGENNVYEMQIAPGGNVGIGLASAGQRLEVNGNAKIDYSVFAPLIYAINASGITVAEMNGSGSIDGQPCYIWSAGNIYAVSDGRLKQNIAPLEEVLPKLDQLSGVSFEWNHLSASVGHKEGEKSIGIIAQDMQKVFPELVLNSTKNQKYMAIDYSKFTAVLLQAVKELKGQNEAMQRQIEDLQEKIKNLEKQK